MALYSDINDMEINGVAVNGSLNLAQLFVSFWEDSVVPWPAVYREGDKGTVVCVPFENRNSCLPYDARDMCVLEENRSMERPFEDRHMDVARDLETCRD